MDFFHTDLVRPLHLAENIFLEVLLPNFTLSRSSGAEGVKLEVTFRKDSPALWNRDGRDTIKTRMGAGFDDKVRKYKQKLDAILLDGKSGSFAPNDPDFLWRWASAGALPIISLGEESYYCFFYRDIFPIGWNIANGATDTLAELLDPLRALERELGEELVVASRSKKTRYVLKPGKDQPLDQVAFGNFRRLWREQFPELDLLNYKTRRLAFTWDVGPDEIVVNTEGGQRKLNDCFVNINPADFGIELDRIAPIAITDDVVLCDGETTPSRVLNRPVGLFKVQTLDTALANKRSIFEPDIFFHSGEKFCWRGEFYSGEKLPDKKFKRFKDFLSGVMRTDVQSWRTPPVITAFEKALEKDEEALGLCPVTESIVRRHSAYIRQISGGKMIPGATQAYEVFLAFGDPDRDWAQEVFNFITSEICQAVFFAPDSLRQHPGLWNKGIYPALRSAGCFVVVATNPEPLKRGWVNFEINFFHQIHPDGDMIPIISGFAPHELPDPLPAFDALTCSDKREFGAVRERLKTRLFNCIARRGAAAG